MYRSFGDTILIGGVCLFASWTVFCFVSIFLDSRFSDLMLWCFVPLLFGLLIWSFCLRGLTQSGGHVVGRNSGLIPTPAPQGKLNWVLWSVVVIAYILCIVDAPYWIAWVALLCATFMVFCRAFTPGKKKSAPFIPCSTSTWNRIGVLCLIALGAVLVAFTHRSELDDSQYLNFVVTALDYPLEPLYSHSGLWLDRNVPLELPIYRFHSYELLVAALSHAFGVEHKVFYYMILPPIFGGVAILVHWRLAQYLMARHAFSVLLAWLVLIIALGESHRAFGNFAFVRLFQGKSILVSVALPLCLLLGLRYAEAPDWRTPG